MENLGIKIKPKPSDMEKIAELMDCSINKLNNLIKKNNMELHEIIEIHNAPNFRKMRVESGFMYNFWNFEKDDYNDDWTFVPDESDCEPALRGRKQTKQLKLRSWKRIEK